MEINEILNLKFPTADFKKDIILQDDGGGVYISQWNLENVPHPTTIDLEQWEQEVQEKYKQLKFNELNFNILEQLKIIDEKSIRALREGNSQRLSELNNQAVLLRSQFIEVE